VPRPILGSVPYGVNIRDCTKPNLVAITLDDGPYLYTIAALDTLKAAGVKATFFVVADNGGKGEVGTDIRQDGIYSLARRSTTRPRDTRQSFSA
jgi:peptidoglycan/xylan/chitin deacetylase (PgdA/CDA1 family)